MDLVQGAFPFAEGRAVRRVETPAARRTDPSTSHEAAEAITKEGKRGLQQAQVADAVRRHPGLTTQELHEASGLERYMIARRVSECETAGDIVRMPKRKCSVTGRMAEPWRPA